MNVRTFLINAILELKDVDEADLIPDLTLEQLALDSLDYVEIQVGIKKNFGVDMQSELFSSGTISTLGQLNDYIEQHKAGQAVSV
jgi:acyl carrier protein